MEKLNKGQEENFSGIEYVNRLEETYQKMTEVNDSVSDFLNNFIHSKTGKRLNGNLADLRTQDDGNKFLSELLGLGDVWRTLTREVGYLYTLRESIVQGNFTQKDVISMEKYYNELTQQVIARLDKIKNEFEIEPAKQN